MTRVGFKVKTGSGSRIKFKLEGLKMTLHRVSGDIQLDVVLLIPGINAAAQRSIESHWLQAVRVFYHVQGQSNALYCAQGG